MTKVTQLSLDDEGGLNRRRIHLREISGDSDAPLETVGQDLRAARLRRGDDLSTVSKTLKIRKDHLEAVEEDHLEALPGKTYAVGFVRSYAGYLGLDVSQTVERFKQEISGRHDEHPPQNAAIHQEDSRRLPQGWRIMAGLVGLAVIYGAWHLLSAGPAPEPVPPPPAIAPPSSAPHPVPQKVTALPPPGTRAVPSPAANVTPQPKPPLQPGASHPSSLAAQPTLSLPAATPSPALPAVPPQPQGTAQPQGTVYGRLNHNPRVVLRARGDAHVEVRGADGTFYINRSLKAGDSYQLPNLVGLSLSTDDAGAVEIDLDGMAMGKAGGNEEAVDSVSMDPQDITDRFGH